MDTNAVGGFRKLDLGPVDYDAFPEFEVFENHKLPLFEQRCTKKGTVGARLC